MSKKNIPKILNPLAAVGKSNKKDKKQTLSNIGAFINDQQDISPDPSSEQAPRLKKLKKLGDKQKQQQQKFIEEKPEQDYENEQEQSQQKEESFEKFQCLNDEQIKQVQNDMMNKKSKNKKVAKKGEQEIDKYIQKHKGQEKIKKSQTKQKKSNMQMSLKAMFQMSSQNRIQPTSSKIEQQKNSSSSSQSVDELDLYRKKLEMRQLNNDMKGGVKEQEAIKRTINAGLKQEEAIKRAIAQSLKQSKKNQPAHIPIDNYSFSQMMNKKQTHNEKQKELPKKQQIKSDVSRKREKSVSKEKQQKAAISGPLKGLGVVLTGQFQPYSKNQILELLQKLGAITPKSITKKTTHLLQGCYVVNSFGKRTDQDVRTTNKSTEAAQKKITIIGFDKIDDFFIEKTGKSLQQHMQKDKPLKQTRFDEKLVQINKNATSASAAKTVAQEEIEIEHKKPETCINSISVSWTQKYKPKSSEQIIGQNSQLKNLRQWLQVWEDIHIRGNKRDVKQSYNSFMPSGTINSNAALLSGDAGLGKTTAARLIAGQFGYSIVQYNASDTRNKKSVELIAAGKNNLSFLGDKSKQMLKTLIIMDQVDGMSGGDRGGISAIIDMIKKTRIPIICICNDRQATKIRSLAGHCFDIKFHKPDQRLIIKRLQRIIELEGGTSSSIALKSLVQLLQNDIRQILTYLQVIFKAGNKHINEEVIRKRCGNTKDNSLTINHFEATKILLSRTMFKQMTIPQRIDFCYVDSDMIPLMVQHNYLDACPKRKLSVRQFKRLALATQAIAIGDTFERTIMRNQNYCLMPNKMFLSCVYPSEMICENIGFPKFTEWLGKFSSERKNKRLVKQMKNPLNIVTSATFQSVKNHFAPMLMERMYRYLAVQQPAYQNIVEFMIHYGITPAILAEHLTSLQFSKQRQNMLKGIETIKKTKLTKMWNKKHESLKVKKQRKKGVKAEHVKYDPVLGEMQHESEQQEEDEREGEDSELIVEKKTGKSKVKKNG